MNHTPGPWHAAHLRIIGESPGIDIGAENGANIAIVYQDKFDRDTKECRSNARLIAAAPTLLRACRLAMAAMSHKTDCCTMRPTEEWREKGSVSFDECCCEISIVKAAIAKAEGKP